MSFTEEIQKAHEAKKRQDDCDQHRKWEELYTRVQKDWSGLFGQKAAEAIGFYIDKNHFPIDGMDIEVINSGGGYFLDYKLIRKCHVCGEGFEVMLPFRRASPEEQPQYKSQNLAVIGEALETKHAPYVCQKAQEKKAPITTGGRLIEALNEFVLDRISQE